MDGARIIRAAVYARRSTDHQDRSIGDQIDAIRTFAAAHAIELVAHYVDDAISGTSSEGRDAFLRMIADACAEPRPFDCVVVYDLKRFGRMDNDETGYYRHILRMHGVRVIYTSEGFTDSFIDDLVRPVKQWQARQESKDLAKVTIRGLISRFSSKSGCWVVGNPPYGYDRKYEDANGKFLFIARLQRDRTRLILGRTGQITRSLAKGERLLLSDRDVAKLTPGNPNHVAVVRRVFFEYTQQGVGCQSIAARLNHECIVTPHTVDWCRRYKFETWIYKTLAQILHNPAYVGDVIWNRSTSATFYCIRGRTAVDRSLSEANTSHANQQQDWLVARDAHPPLVSRRVFDETQRLWAHRRGMSRAPEREFHPQDSRVRYSVRDLVTCARCKRQLKGRLWPRKISSRRWDPYMARMYMCHFGSIGPPACQHGMIRQRILERLVTEAVLGWYEESTRARQEEMRQAARQYVAIIDHAVGAPLGKRYAAAAAKLWLTSAQGFIRELRHHLCSPEHDQRRLAMRRCLDHAVLDTRERRLTLWLKKMPLLGLTVGGCARVQVKLPANLGSHSLVTMKRRRPCVRSLADHLQGRAAPIAELAHQLRSYMLGLGSEVTEVYRRYYAAYTSTRHFAYVRIQSKRIVLNLMLPVDRIKAPPGLVRSVAGVYSQVHGDFEVSVASEADLELAKPFIQESYRRVRATHGNVNPSQLHPA